MAAFFQKYILSERNKQIHIVRFQLQEAKQIINIQA
jgi:hypothetical protein